MGIRFTRQKPRHWLLSLAYKLNRFAPVGMERKLDFLLDLEWIAGRLAHENGVRLALYNEGRNGFLLNRIEPTDRVLDLGCGTGRLAATIEAKVVGIDHSERSIGIARRNCPQHEFVCADARDYLAQAEHFDVAILSHLLEHLDEPADALRLVQHHADRIYVEVPDFEAPPLNRLRLARNRRLIYSDNDHVTEFDRRELEALFASVGLTVDDSEFASGYLRYWVH